MSNIGCVSDIVTIFYEYISLAGNLNFFLIIFVICFVFTVRHPVTDQQNGRYKNQATKL